MLLYGMVNARLYQVSQMKRAACKSDLGVGDLEIGQLNARKRPRSARSEPSHGNDKPT